MSNTFKSLLSHKTEFVKYILWSNANPCNKTNDLMQKMKEVLGPFNMHTEAKACKSLMSRIKPVVTADRV